MRAQSDVRVHYALQLATRSAAAAAIGREYNAARLSAQRMRNGAPGRAPGRRLALTRGHSEDQHRHVERQDEHRQQQPAAPRRQCQAAPMAPRKLTAGVPASMRCDQQRIGLERRGSAVAPEPAPAGPTAMPVVSQCASDFAQQQAPAATARSRERRASRPRSRSRKCGRATEGPRAAARSTESPAAMRASRLRSGPRPSGISETTIRKKPSAVPMAPPSRTASLTSRRTRAEKALHAAIL